MGTETSSQAGVERGHRALKASQAAAAPLTCDVQLVQSVIGQGCVPGTGLRFVHEASRGGPGGLPALAHLLE